MSPKVFEPRRLREGAEQPRSIEERLARHLSILAVDASMPRLRRFSSAPPGRRRYLSALIRVTAVAILTVVVSGIAAAAATYVARLVLARPVAAGAGGPSKATRSHRIERAGEPSKRSDDTPTGSLVAGPPPQPVGMGPRALEAPPGIGTAPFQRPALRPAPRSTAPGVRLSYDRPAEARRVVEREPPPESDTLTEEAGLLRSALSALHRDHDASRALALLDDYDRRFGQGALAPEAASARAQAWLQLGDYARARALLDGLPLSQEAYPVELRVTRGELRSLTGQCRDAVLDFDAVLRGSGTADELARALFGRASCRVRLGDADGAQADRRRYLKEFPEGPAARQLMSPP